jgi:hypothetical protein
MRTSRTRRFVGSLVATAIALPISLLLGVAPAHANDIHEAAYGANAYDYIRDAGQSTEHSLGQGVTTGTEHTYLKVHHVAVYLQRVGTAENACVWLSLRSTYNGADMAYKCVNAANVSTTAQWVDFYFDAPVGITPGATYFVYVRYYGSCDTCMRLYYSTTDSYRGAVWPNVVIGQDNASCCYQRPTNDLAFLYAVDHSPRIVTKPARNIGTTSAQLVGGNDDGAALTSTIYFQWGTTTSYGNQSGAFTCNGGSECWQDVGGLQPNTLYNFRACGSNTAGLQCGINRTFVTALNQTVPGAPTTPVVTAPAAGQLRLTWAPPLSNGGSALTKYRVFYGNTLPLSTYVDVSTATLSRLETGLPVGLRYYQVQAFNAIGGGAMASANGRAFADYDIEIKAWIPHASLVDPVTWVNDNYEVVTAADASSGRPPCHTSPWWIAALPILADGTFDGDGHTSYEGSFRVRSRVTLRWNGSSISTLVRDATNLHNETVQRRSYWNLFQSEDCELGRATANDLPEAQQLNSTQFRLSYSSENPRTAAYAFGAGSYGTPTIDGDVTGTFSATGLSLTFTTDEFPNHGIRVRRNGLTQRTITATNASCVGGSNAFTLKSALESQQASRTVFVGTGDTNITSDTWNSESC